MGYKILGFVVWKAARLYLRRRMPGTARSAALAGIAVAIIAGLVVAGRQQQSSS